MSDFPQQFLNIYDRTKRKAVKKPGLSEAGELFKSCAKHLENPEHKSLCLIGASRCYQNCGEEILQAKALVAAADLLSQEPANSFTEFSAASTLYGRALDIYLHQNCLNLAFQLCLQVALFAKRSVLRVKAIPWLQKALEVETRNLADKVNCTDQLVRAYILEGNFERALTCSRNLDRHLESGGSAELPALEKLLLDWKVTNILLCLAVEPASLTKRETLFLDNLRAFEESSLPQDLSIDLGAFVLSLEEKDRAGIIEAKGRLEKILRYEESVLITELVRNRITLEPV